MSKNKKVIKDTILLTKFKSFPDAAAWIKSKPINKNAKIKNDPVPGPKNHHKILSLK